VILLPIKSGEAVIEDAAKSANKNKKKNNAFVDVKNIFIDVCFFIDRIFEFPYKDSSRLFSLLVLRSNYAVVDITKQSDTSEEEDDS
jgi:hypothetical protein